MTDSERLDRIERELGEIKKTLVMTLAVQQLSAIKNGIVLKDLQAASPVPVPTPFDVLDGLLKRNRAADS